MSCAFPTTHWTAVLAAADARDPRSRDALAEICGNYWLPLYAFARRQGASAEDARDLVQGYFAQLLEKRYLRDVSPARGRFRSFLLVSLKHYLSNERDRARTRKRSPGVALMSIDAEGSEAGLQIADCGALDPERLYEQQWALTLLGRALARLGEEAAAEGRRERFERLKGFLGDGDDPGSCREAANALGISEGAVKTAVCRLRRRFGELLRDEVAHTVVHPDEVPDELRHLLQSVATH